MSTPRIVAPKQSFSSAAYNASSEYLVTSNGAMRPCLLILKLTYKGQRRRFAVPLRSNISASAPSNEYFALPNTKKTRPRNRAGLHFIKMFPVTVNSYESFRLGTAVMRNSSDAIRQHMPEIVKAAQDYLIRYEQGNRSPFAVDIDAIIQQVLPRF